VSTGDLTTTSYAILGLLAIRPWSTYELAQQMERSLKHFWPRAQSRIYEEPKRLVREGLATATKERVGNRPRTTYSITGRGRDALAAWLARPGAGPVIEFEALLKVFFSEHGTRAGALANLGAIREWTQQQHAENVAFARLLRDSGGPFPERRAQIVLIGRFLVELADALDRWSVWATEQVSAWSDEGGVPEPDWSFVEQVAARPIAAARLPGASDYPSGSV